MEEHIYSAMYRASQFPSPSTYKGFARSNYAMWSWLKKYSVARSPNHSTIITDLSPGALLLTGIC